MTNFARMPGLLTALRLTFGEGATWRGGAFSVRFRIDPFTVGLSPADSGLEVTETWAYTERALIPRDLDGRLPDIGDFLTIRGRDWEIVSVGDDDIGERQFRLLHDPVDRRPRHEPNGSREPSFAERGPAHSERGGPGRPSRRSEIEHAAAVVASRTPAGTPRVQTFAEIRREITGRDGPQPGLSDKTLYKALQGRGRRLQSINSGDN